MADKAFGKQKSCTYTTFIDKPKGTMFGRSGVGAQGSGQTGTTRGTPNKFGISVGYGTGHMVGPQHSKAAKPL